MSTSTQALVLALISEIDRMDEDQIIQELAGDHTKVYAYSFPMDGKIVKGLSWAGYKEVALRWGNISISKPEVEDVGSELRVLIEATDLVNNVTVWAGTHQPKMRRINDDDDKGGYHEVRDQFVFEKAVSKAQRNVLKNLIPHAVQAAAIEAVLTGKIIPLGRTSEDKPTPRLGKPYRKSLAAPAPTPRPSEAELRRDQDDLTRPADPTRIETIGDFFNRARATFGLPSQAAILGPLGCEKPVQILQMHGSFEKAWEVLVEATRPSKELDD